MRNRRRQNYIVGGEAITGDEQLLSLTAGVNIAHLATRDEGEGLD